MMDLPQVGDPGAPESARDTGCLWPAGRGTGADPRVSGYPPEGGVQFKHGGLADQHGHIGIKDVPTLPQRGANLKARHGPTDEALAKFGVRLQEKLL